MDGSGGGGGLVDSVRAESEWIPFVILLDSTQTHTRLMWCLCGKDGPNLKKERKREKINDLAS
jgi:hypothetical protein